VPNVASDGVCLMTDRVTAEDLASDADAGYRPPGIMDEIHDIARQTFVTELEIEELESRLKQKKREFDQLTTKILPGKMDQARLRKVTIEATDNFPAFTVEVRTAYNANIASGWDEDRRKAAFNWLEDNGHGSLIKTDVTTHFSRNNRTAVAEFVEALKENDMNFKVRESVHNQTLSAWLKEMVEAGRPLPPLETIGGYIERQALIKQEQDT
jgi:hypothetical protein